jgi:sn1-specific diacylglycerol lipase
MWYNSRILLLLPEVGWNIMGTMWMFGETVQCSSEHFTTTVTKGNVSSVAKTKMK